MDFQHFILTAATCFYCFSLPPQHSRHVLIQTLTNPTKFIRLRRFVYKGNAKSHTAAADQGSALIQKMLCIIYSKSYINNHIVTEVTNYSNVECKWNWNIVTKYWGLRQIISKHIEKIISYLRGRKMAERKKEVAVRGIVGYEWTSQSPNSQALVLRSDKISLSPKHNIS